MAKKLKRIIWYGFVAANLLLVLFCLLACLSPILQPDNNAFIALLGMGFPLLFGAVLLCCLYWMVKKSKWAWVHLIAIAASFYQFSHTFGFHPLNSFKQQKDSTSLRVVTWNLSSWGLTKRNNTNKINYRQEMTTLLAQTNADIICLQEYHFLREKTFRDSIIPELADRGFKYTYFCRANYTMRMFRSAHVTGVAIVSKYPITDTAHFDYTDHDFSESLIYADVLFQNKTIRIFTTHLESVRFETYDYEALHNLKEPANASITQARAVAWKLKQAYKKRAAQAAILHQKIKESPHPVIVCGDFNDVPGSYVYTTVKGDLQDVFLRKGFGFGRTYRFISPTLRIDYILTDKKFTVEQYKKMEVKYSDHYPVVADLSITD